MDPSAIVHACMYAQKLNIRNCFLTSFFSAQISAKSLGCLEDIYIHTYIYIYSYDDMLNPGLWEKTKN